MEKFKKGDKIVFVKPENKFVRRRLTAKYDKLEKNKVYSVESIITHPKLVTVITIEGIAKCVYNPIYFEELKEHRKRKLEKLQ